MNIWLVFIILIAVAFIFAMPILLQDQNDHKKER